MPRSERPRRVRSERPLRWAREEAGVDAGEGGEGEGRGRRVTVMRGVVVGRCFGRRCVQRASGAAETDGTAGGEAKAGIVERGWRGEVGTGGMSELRKQREVGTRTCTVVIDN